MRKQERPFLEESANTSAATDGNSDERDRDNRFPAPESELDSLVEEAVAIGRNCVAHIPEELRRIDDADLLYDERGLPK
ncbi:MAG TPA: hypothetical protein VFY10_15390 [Dehalococcoidia bacterium]|nr:hypothetical protein [Dehalococcoidia bacterium]